MHTYGEYLSDEITSLNEKIHLPPVFMISQ